MMWIKLLTWFKGELVGKDSFGNRYYQGKGKSLKERRWVIYKGIAEASKVPAEWHGWLHHVTLESPLKAPVKKWEWEKNSLPNLSGTRYAYYPPGHFFAGEKRNLTAGDYVAWQPHEVKDENKSI